MHMSLNHRKMPTFAPNKKNANYPFLNYLISKKSKLCQYSLLALYLIAKVCIQYKR